MAEGGEGWGPQGPLRGGSLGRARSSSQGRRGNQGTPCPTSSSSQGTRPLGQQWGHHRLAGLGRQGAGPTARSGVGSEPQTSVSGLGRAPLCQGLAQAASVLPGWQDHRPEAQGRILKRYPLAGICIQQVEQAVACGTSQSLYEAPAAQPQLIATLQLTPHPHRPGTHRHTTSGGAWGGCSVGEACGAEPV